MPRIQAPPAGAIADAVWTRATRSLTVDPATDAGAAALVWARATRTLTADLMPFAAVGARVSVAAGAVLDLRPAAGKFRHLSAAWAAGGAVDAGVYDGVNFDASAQNLGQLSLTGVVNNARGFSLRNSTAGAITAHYAGLERG